MTADFDADPVALHLADRHGLVVSRRDLDGSALLRAIWRHGQAAIDAAQLADTEDQAVAEMVAAYAADHPENHPLHGMRDVKQHEEAS